MHASLATSTTPAESQLHACARTWLDAGAHALIVSVAEVKGSTPREAGTRMLVSDGAVLGTIGGGHLEWQAIDLARHALRERYLRQAGSFTPAWLKTFPLGPTLGQCCGGVVTLLFEPLNASTLAAWVPSSSKLHVELHGAGHVGQAIIRLLRDIDCTVRWIDMRDVEDNWPGRPDASLLASLPEHIIWLPSDQPESEVDDAPPGACHLVLTHRHDLDLRIIEAVLKRGDARFAGLIGSATKRASFLHRLAQKGLNEAQLACMVCPIGVPGITGKAPAVIAISVLAQLLAIS